MASSAPREGEAKMKIAALAAATMFAASPAAARVFVVPGYSVSLNDVLKPCSPSVLAHALKPGTFAWAKDQCTWVPPGTEMPKCGIKSWKTLASKQGSKPMRVA
jgi:hypothetical protein